MISAQPDAPFSAGFRDKEFGEPRGWTSELRPRRKSGPRGGGLVQTALTTAALTKPKTCTCRTLGGIERIEANGTSSPTTGQRPEIDNPGGWATGFGLWDARTSRAIEVIGRRDEKPWKKVVGEKQVPGLPRVCRFPPLPETTLSRPVRSPCCGLSFSHTMKPGAGQHGPVARRGEAHARNHFEVTEGRPVPASGNRMTTNRTVGVLRPGDARVVAVVLLHPQRRGDHCCDPPRRYANAVGGRLRSR